MYRKHKPSSTQTDDNQRQPKSLFKELMRKVKDSQNNFNLIKFSGSHSPVQSGAE